MNLIGLVVSPTVTSYLSRRIYGEKHASCALPVFVGLTPLALILKTHDSYLRHIQGRNGT